MRWLIGIAMILVFIAIAVRMIGASLPVKHTVSVTRTIPHPAGDVWARISDPGQWQQWRSDVTRLEMLPENRFRVTDSNGTVLYRIEIPAERTLVTVIEQEGLPYGGRWIWLVEPETDHSTRVTITEEGEVYSPMFRFFGHYLFGYDSTVKSVLDQLETAAG